MTRENGLVLSNAVDVGLDDPAQESVVEVGEVVTVAVTVGRYTAIDTSRIAMPKVHIDSRNRLARAGVNKLDIEVERNSLLTIGDIATNELSINIVRALSDFRLQNASRVIGEQQSLVVAVRDAGRGLVGMVVSGEVTAGERGADATLGAGLAGHGLAASEGVLHITSAAELRSAGAD